MEWYLFATAWGWSGVGFEQGKLRRTLLPASLEVIMNNIARAKTGHIVRFIADKDESVPLINNIRAYYRGTRIERWEVSLALSSMSAFSRVVMEYVFTIPYGQTRTYGEVARCTGRPRSARAVGQVMKNNPVPLVVPCHRVVSGRGPGGFSAAGGVATKLKMLAWEQDLCPRPV